MFTLSDLGFLILGTLFDLKRTSGIQSWASLSARDSLLKRGISTDEFKVACGVLLFSGYMNVSDDGRMLSITPEGEVAVAAEDAALALGRLPHFLDA